MRIDLDREIGNKGHVFVYDENGKLRMKYWFHGDGNIIWRNFDAGGKTVGWGRSNALIPYSGKTIKPKSFALPIAIIDEHLTPKQTCPQCEIIHFIDKYSGCCGAVCESIMKDEC